MLLSLHYLWANKNASCWTPMLGCYNSPVKTLFSWRFWHESEEATLSSWEEPSNMFHIMHQEDAESTNYQWSVLRCSTTPKGIYVLKPTFYKEFHLSCPSSGHIPSTNVFCFVFFSAYYVPDTVISVYNSSVNRETKNTVLAYIPP